MSSPSSSTTNRLVGYFVSKTAAARNFPISAIPADQLTHVIYAFAEVSADGECVSSNAQNDAVNLPQLLQLKQQHPKLLTLISIGGSAGSAHFAWAAATVASRLRLAGSCVRFMKQYGFDGIDIAWEFPSAGDKREFSHC